MQKFKSQNHWLPQKHTLLLTLLFLLEAALGQLFSLLSITSSDRCQLLSRAPKGSPALMLSGEVSRVSFMNSPLGCVISIQTFYLCIKD